MFRLTWEPHYGGAGNRLTWGEALEMDVAEVMWLLERQDQQRAEERRELQRSQQKPGRSIDWHGWENQ